MNRDEHAHKEIKGIKWNSCERVRLLYESLYERG